MFEETMWKHHICKTVTLIFMVLLRVPLAARGSTDDWPTTNQTEEVAGEGRYESRVIQYPRAPLPLADNFIVKVNGREMPVYNLATFRCCPFAISGSVKVEVTYRNGSVQSCQINPVSARISGRQYGRTVAFTLDKPRKLEIQINHAYSQLQEADKLLYLFADAPEVNPPGSNDPSVIYYGPGSYFPPGGVLTINDDDPHSELYVAPGAVLNAALVINRNNKPFRVLGRGFIRNPSTPAEKMERKANFSLALANCKGVVVEDLVFFDSNWMAVKFIGGHDNTICNVKVLNLVVNSDGITFHGCASNNVVENSLIVGNDNLIVIGAGDWQLRPSHNTIRGCTFVKSSFDGNWVFPQGDGAIGSCNLIADCDVIRCNWEPALIRAFYGKLTTIDNLVFRDIRVQALAENPAYLQMPNGNRFLSLESDGIGYVRTMTFKNIYLPKAVTSFIAPGRWQVTFDHVFIAGKVAKCDADLMLTKGDGVVTKYVY